MIDYAKHIHKESWFRHPVFGDPSFDTFTRHGHNPIHRGSFPFEWPVNATLFPDPVSGRLYAYITQYYKGYWSIRDPELSLHCVAYRSDDRGRTWESVGIVLQGTKHQFDGEDGHRGGAADMYVVYDKRERLYHAVFGWATSSNTDGGIGYARAPAPEGPWVIGERPLHQESKQPLIEGTYKRVYASSLIRRDNDWLIVAMTSTPRNWGGTWAFVAMTADRPEGPYSAPRLLLYPQSTAFHSPISEFFPAFEDERHVYAPFTSLAGNRNFQLIYRAEREQAHMPEGWSIFKYGSLWHAESLEHERTGIWGQTFAGILEENGRFKVIYPAKTGPEDDRGTINYAECDWESVDNGDSFVLSAPCAPAITFLLGTFREFSLEARITVEEQHEQSVIWAYNGPLGPDRATAGAVIHPLMQRDMLRLSWQSAAWTLSDRDADGTTTVLAGGTYSRSDDGSISIEIRYDASNTVIAINGELVWEGALSIRSGKLGLWAGAGGNMRVEQWKVDRRPDDSRWTNVYLASEGLLGAGAGGTAPDEQTSQTNKAWSLLADDPNLKFGTGYLTHAIGSRIKWNFSGRGQFRVWAPRGGRYGGVIRLYVDGEPLAELDLRGDRHQPSEVIYKGGVAEHGYHAVVLELLDGALVGDSFELLAGPA